MTPIEQKTREFLKLSIPDMAEEHVMKHCVDKMNGMVSTGELSEEQALARLEEMIKEVKGEKGLTASREAGLMG